MRTNTSDLKKERNKAIYQQYCYMYFTEMKREEAIWPVLKKIFWLEENTLYRIVINMSRAAAEDPDQLKLPLTEQNEHAL